MQITLSQRVASGCAGYGTWQCALAALTAYSWHDARLITLPSAPLLALLAAHLLLLPLVLRVLVGRDRWLVALALMLAENQAVSHPALQGLGAWALMLLFWCVPALAFIAYGCWLNSMETRARLKQARGAASGDGCESNTPRPAVRPASSFEDCGVHRDPTTPL